MSRIETMNSGGLLAPAFATLRYYFHDLWNYYGDKRVQSFPFFASGPWLTLSLVATYLSFVKIVGPHMMRDRKPMDLRRIMAWYNLSMVILSGGIFFEGCYLLNFGLDTWGCGWFTGNRSPYYERRFLRLAWVFFFSKLIEFADTTFFVLRKKNSQVSTLHVIHHSLVPISVWFGYKFAPDANNAFFPLMNSLIHTLMYTYYGLTAIGPEHRVTKYIVNRYKKYLTGLQMGQFVLAIVHCISALLFSQCSFPRASLFINLGNACLFLALFYSFYSKNYTKSTTTTTTTTTNKSITTKTN